MENTQNPPNAQTPPSAKPARKPGKLFPVLFGLWLGAILAVFVQGFLDGPSGVVEVLATVANAAIVWALAGLLVLFIGEQERTRHRASWADSSTTKSPSFLIGVAVPVVAVLLGATPAAWAAHRLHATISRADRIEIRDGGFDCHWQSHSQRALAVITNSAEIAAFNRMIRFKGRASLLRCRCCGYPGIDWWRDGKRVALTSLQHGRAIRWDGFTGDRPLTKSAAKELCRWLEDHGIDPDGSASLSALYAPPADLAESESHAENAESAEPRPGEAGPLPEGAAERSEAGGVSHAEGAESESHAENAETAEL